MCFMQGADLPRCRLLLTLKDFEREQQADHDSALADLECAIKAIAAAMAVLEAWGVEVFVQLKPFEGGGWGWPSPARLAVMAPVIQDVFVPNAVEHNDKWTILFQSAHILALQSAGQLRRLCINCHIGNTRFEEPRSMASFTNLTSLQLGHCRVVDLSDLQHLRLLLELRLGFQWEYTEPLSCDVKCAKALGSSSHLQHVSLL